MCFSYDRTRKVPRDRNSLLTVSAAYILQPFRCSLIHRSATELHTSTRRHTRARLACVCTETTEGHNSLSQFPLQQFPAQRRQHQLDLVGVNVFRQNETNLAATGGQKEGRNEGRTYSKSTRPHWSTHQGRELSLRSFS